jgi:hypothetical protein
MAKKQLSGHQKRMRAKARAEALGILMPPRPRIPTIAEISSLTGVAREKARNYRFWRQGKLPHEEYLVSVRGLSALATTLTTLEAEKQRQIDERLLSAVEAVEAQQSGAAVIDYTPAALGPPGGELMPRDPADDPAPSNSMEQNS